MKDINRFAELREWKNSRLGKITASRFHDIQLTERKELRHKKKAKATKADKLEYIKRYKFSNLLPEKPQLKDIDPIYHTCPAREIIEPKLTKTAEAYLNELIGEILTGKQSLEFSSRATDWGNEHEPFALKLYEERQGFAVHSSKLYKMKQFPLIGATPDGIIKEFNGLVEAKSPYYTKNHIRTLRTKEVPKEYKDQVFGQLLVTGADWCDFISYDPRCSPEYRLVIVSVQAHEYKEEITALKKRLLEFLAIYKKELKRLNLSATNIQSLHRKIAA